MSDEPVVRRAGPGSGPGGAPTAIALSPILSARYRSRDLERIRAAAPGARLVTVSVEGLADGPLDDVEVMLRGWLGPDAFDRLLARAPRLSWVHSATSGVERALTPAAPRARPRRHQRPRRLQPADRRVRADDDPRGQPPAAAAPRAPARADLAAARGRRAARRHRRDRRPRARSAGRSRRSRRPSAAGWSPSAADRADDRPRPARPATTRRPFGELHARPGRRPRDAAGAARASPTSSSSPRR